MKRKILSLVIGLPVGIALIWVLSWVLLMFVLTGMGTKFYKDCSSIELGMSREQVKSIMKSHNQNTGYTVTSDSDGIGWYTLGPLDDYQCSISFDASGSVSYVHMVFD